MRRSEIGGASRLAILAALFLTPQAIAQEPQAEVQQRPFQLIPSVEVHLKAVGQASKLILGTSTAVGELRGLSSSNTVDARPAKARGSASVELLHSDERSIDVKLNVSSKSRGQSEAESKARALIALKLPDDLMDKPAILRLKVDQPAGLSATVRSPDGEQLNPLDGQPGRYLIDRGTDGTVLIDATVTGQDSDLAAEKLVETSSVNFRAVIEPGPILFPKLTQFIRGGTKTDSYSQVGSLLLDGQIHCTATLVAPRTLLTAAHCVAGYEGLVNEGRLTFSNGSLAAAPQQRTKIERVAYPQDRQAGYYYSRSEDYRDDIALAYLSVRSSIAPVAIHRGNPPWATLSLQDLLFVGYGYNGIEPDTAGVKRHASWKVAAVQPRTVSWTTSGASTCRFDSGGPAFQIDGLTLVAITSNGSPDCAFGVNTRVDAFIPWLEGKIR